MKLRFMAMTTAAWLSVSMLAAHAQNTTSAYTGKVVRTTGDAGLVILLRGGETFSLSIGDPLFDGDRVITRVGATAMIEVDNCTRTLEQGSTIVIDAEFCEAVLASADETTLASADDIASGVGTGAALPFLGAVVAGGGLAAATVGDGVTPPTAQAAATSSSP